MRDQRNPLHGMFRTNIPDGVFQLSAGVLGTAKRRVVFGGLRHFWIGIRQAAEAVEIEPPTMEPGRREFLAPRPPVEALRDRESRWESSAVHIEHDVAANCCRARRSQVAQEQRHACMMARDANVFFARVKLGNFWLVHARPPGDFFASPPATASAQRPSKQLVRTHTSAPTVARRWGSLIY